MNFSRPRKSVKAVVNPPKGAKKKLEAKKQPHKYKTELCKNFGAGLVCKFGDSCIFAHGEHQLVSSPEPTPHDGEQQQPRPVEEAKPWCAEPEAKQVTPFPCDWLRSKSSEESKEMPAKEIGSEVCSHQKKEATGKSERGRQQIKVLSTSRSDRMSPSPESQNKENRESEEQKTQAAEVARASQPASSPSTQIYSAILSELQSLVSANKKVKQGELDDDNTDANVYEVDPSSPSYLYSYPQIPQLKLASRLSCFQQIYDPEKEHELSEAPTLEESKDQSVQSPAKFDPTVSAYQPTVTVGQSKVAQMQASWQKKQQELSRRWEAQFSRDNSRFPSIAEVSELEDEHCFSMKTKLHSRRFRKQRFTRPEVCAVAQPISAF